MSSTMTVAALAGQLAAEEPKIALPMSPTAFGLTALLVFAALFGLTWAFRNVAKKR
jgi:hypothetical protein